MKSRFIPWIAMLLMLWMTGCALPERSLPPMLDARIDGAVQDAMARGEIPGAVVLVGQRDRILKEACYGWRELKPFGESVPLTADTLFDMASLTKVTATATLCALLIQDGVVALDDPVNRHLPAWPDEGVTLRHLATHTSGLMAYLHPVSGKIAEKHPGLPSYDAVLKAIAEKPKVYETGKGVTYSCLNFELLGRVLEAAAGEDMAAVLRRRVWGPLGMANTAFRLSPDRIKACAPTENGLRGVVHDPLARFYGIGKHLPGNAGLFSTGRDLARFLQMLLAGGRHEGRVIMKPGTVRMLLANQAPPASGSQRAMGWIIGRHKDYVPRSGRHEVRLHSGFTGTYLWFDLESGVFCVILTSRLYPDGKGAAGPLRKAIVRALCDEWIQPLKGSLERKS